MHQNAFRARTRWGDLTALPRPELEPGHRVTGSMIMSVSGQSYLLTDPVSSLVTRFLTLTEQLNDTAAAVSVLGTVMLVLGLVLGLDSVGRGLDAIMLYTYVQQESSAKLTNQRVSHAFASSPLSFHPVIFCLLPSTSIVFLVFYLVSTGISEQHV